ncbi:DUF952 domain-containing protein [Vibrio neptunius]|uniref:DUF952 domain-containing protein n=1 Tax=Vibrio neptunius TaxID=170651 RepID=UPI0033155FD5
MLYHILTKSEYHKYQNSDTYAPESLTTEGFIHLAYQEQVQKIIDGFFAGVSEIYLLEINKSAVAQCLKDEPPVGTQDDGERYPHLYGSLCKRAVIKTINLIADANGELKFTH